MYRPLVQYEDDALDEDDTLNDDAHNNYRLIDSRLPRIVHQFLSSSIYSARR